MGDCLKNVMKDKVGKLFEHCRNLRTNNPPSSKQILFPPND